MYKRPTEVQTYDETLIPCEHDDQLDRQEFGERFAALKFILRQAIEDDQAVQRNPIQRKQPNIVSGIHD